MNKNKDSINTNTNININTNTNTNTDNGSNVNSNSKNISINNANNINNPTNKEILMEVAFSLSLKYGFDNVTIKQIQKEANVSPGTVYYHFKDKNDILANMIERYIKEEIKEFKKHLIDYEGSVHEKLKFIFYHFAGKELDNENYGIELSNNEKINHSDYELLLLGIYHQHPELRPYFHELNKEMLNIFEDFVEDLKEKNEIRNDIDTDAMALHIFTVVSGFSKLYDGCPTVSIEKFADINIGMICDVICYKKKI